MKITLPANKAVDIPNQSSQTLKAYNDSWNKQSLSYRKQWPMILQYLEIQELPRQSEKH